MNATADTPNVAIVIVCSQKHMLYMIRSTAETLSGWRIRYRAASIGILSHSALVADCFRPHLPMLTGPSAVHFLDSAVHLLQLQLYSITDQ